MSDQVATAVEPVEAGRAALVRRGKVALPGLIVDAGPAAVGKFLEFFAARIANRQTRAAYARAVGQFLAWCEARGLRLETVSPLHVAAYIRTHPGSAPTVEQHLAAIRMLGDWLVVRQVLPVNPAAAVRGPKHVVTKGATPVLWPAVARRLLEAIDISVFAGLPDRALVSVMLYSFARVSAAIGMRRSDYVREGSRGWLRLREKGGRRHDVPAHHRVADRRAQQTDFFHGLLSKPSNCPNNRDHGAAGFDAGVADGLFGLRTRAAIRNWQAARGRRTMRVRRVAWLRELKHSRGTSLTADGKRKPDARSTANRRTGTGSSANWAGTSRRARTWEAS